MNRNDVIDVLSVVAAATRRTVGESDVDVWQAVIGDLDKDYALKAVREHLKLRPGVWLEPGHVYTGARAIRREELDHNPEPTYEAIAARSERIAVVEELAASKAIPGPVKFRRRANSALSVRCPWCGAVPGSRCVVPRTNDNPSGGTHPSRIEAAATAAGDHQEAVNG